MSLIVKFNSGNPAVICEYCRKIIRMATKKEIENGVKDKCNECMDLTILEQLHSPYSIYWDCYNDEPVEENNALESAKISANIAIKFAQFVKDNNYGNGEDTYFNELSWKELFEEFLKLNYDKFR